MRRVEFREAYNLEVDNFESARGVYGAVHLGTAVRSRNSYSIIDTEYGTSTCTATVSYHGFMKFCSQAIEAWDQKLPWPIAAQLSDLHSTV